jgi:hypothetical protein
MAESKNLMGLNLSVNNDLVAEAAREAIVASIAASMSNKEQIVKEFVKSMLSERVLAENGEKPRGYSSERTCSRMEYCVRKALEEIAREEVANMVEEQKPALRDLVRKEFQKKNVQGQFVEMFMDSLADNMTNRYTSKISVEFAKKTEYC